MRIGINGYFLSRPYTGFGDYTIGLLRGLAELDSQNEYFIFIPQKLTISLTLPKNFHFKVVPPLNLFGFSGGKFYWEQIQIMRQAKKQHCQLFHHFYPMFSIFYRSIPQIVSIHDVIPWQFQEYNHSFLVRSLRKFLQWASRFAAEIVTVSETSREEISKTFSLPADKINVIYNGVQKQFKRRLTSRRIKSVLQHYQIRQPYIFYLGGFDVRKNVRRLILAFAKVQSKLPAKLVLAGGVFSPQREIYRDFYQLPELIKKLHLAGRVQLIGPVKNQDLPAIYQGAKIFVSPTLAEGFNIPVLEAFASGVPVACARVSATAEIAAGAALKFNPEDTDAIATSILELWQDVALRRRLILAGRKRAQDFSWRRAAKQLLKIYAKFNQR